MKRLMIFLAALMIFAAPPAEAKKAWVKQHYTKNGTTIRGHYTTVPKHRRVGLSHKIRKYK